MHKHDGNLATLIGVVQKQAGLVLGAGRIEHANISELLEIALRDLIHQRCGRVGSELDCAIADSDEVMPEGVVQFQKRRWPAWPLLRWKSQKRCCRVDLQ